MGWSNEGTSNFTDYATQLINHFDTLECGGQAKIDKETVMKLLNSMSTSNVAICTQIKLNRQGVTFQDDVVSLSTLIATIFPLINVKGRKTLMSETGTNSQVTHATYLNGVEFTDQTWKGCFSIEDYRCIPKQVKKLIGFARRYKCNDKQHK